MKITLSKFQRGQKRHVVLVCTQEEDRDVHQIVYNVVLGAEAAPVREVLRVSRQVRYRFAMKYLDQLMLTFPFADFSPALQARLSRRAKEAFDAIPVPELDLVDFHGELYNFQKIAVGKMMSKKKFLLNDEMGLGKTIMAIAAIIANEAYPALVVVPNSIKYNWRNLVDQFTDLNIVVVDGTREQRADLILKDADITVINQEGLRTKKYPVLDENDRAIPGEYTYEHVNPDLFDIEWKCIVVDEYHRFKNPDALQTIGLHMLDADRKIAMSGTPVLNGRPEEYWSVLHWLWPRRYPNYNMFYNKHCIKEKGRVVAYRNLAEIRDWLEQNSFDTARVLRRRKDQVLEDLPEVTFAIRDVILTPEQRDLYEQIREELILWVQEEPRRIQNALAQMTRLKQACFSPELYDGTPVSAKINQLKEDVAELVRSGEKAILFTQWAKAARILEREFAEYNPAYVDGTVKVSKGSVARGTLETPRQDQVDKFNTDEDCKLFIGTIGSCREGFTLSAATYVALVDEDWVPANNMQAIARSAAGGLRGIGVDHVTVLTYRAVDTVEEDIAELLESKQTMNDRLVEADAGAIVNRITAADIRSLLRMEDN